MSQFLLLSWVSFCFPLVKINSFSRQILLWYPETVEKHRLTAWNKKINWLRLTCAPEWLVGAPDWIFPKARNVSLGRLWCIFISFQRITFNLGNFINLKALFLVVSTDFPELVHVKSWKKLWKGLCNNTLFSVQPTHFPPILTPSRLIWFIYCTVHVEGKVNLVNCSYWKSSFM